MTVRDWLGAVATLAVVTGTLLLARRAITRNVRRLAARTVTGVDDLLADVVERTHPVTLLAVGTWATVVTWAPGTPAQGPATMAVAAVLAIQAGAWGAHVVSVLATRRQSVAAAKGAGTDATVWAAISLLGRAVVWMIASLLALDNVGIDVTALIAGLGIGGLAVGLALQTVLGDVFASLAIVLDRPFAIGDFLVVDDVAGTVEHVGIKTTRVRALSGEQVVIANAELLKGRIRNFQRLAERRNVLSFGVVYETPTDVLARLPVVAREVVEEQTATRFDRAHLCRFGASSIDFEVAYYLLDGDYNHHMDVQQGVLLALLRRFAELGVAIAYPTHTLHVAPPSGPSASPNTMTS